MDDISTDVTGSAPDSGSAAIAAVGSAPAAPTSEPIGAATAAAPVVESGESAAPFVVPENNDDLVGQEQNPHVQGIINLRQHVNTLKSDYAKQLQPFTQLQERWGGVERIEKSLNLVGNLFGTDPTTGQPTVENFVKDIVQLSPQTSWSLYEKLAATELPTVHGPMTPIQGVFQHLKLDWDRIEDYQKLTAGKIAIPGSVQIPEDVDEKDVEAFKHLATGNQALWKSYEPHEKRELLDREQERLNDRAEKEENKRFREELQARDQQNAQRALAAAQEQAVGQVRTEVYQEIRNDLVSQWKPSADEQESHRHYANTMLAVTALIDPLLRGLVQSDLDASGMTINWGELDRAVHTVETQTSQAIAFAKQGEQYKADLAQAAANGARTQVKTILSTAALAFAGVKSAQLQQARTANNGAIDLARQGRPAIAGTATEGNGFKMPVDTPEQRQALYKSLPV